MMQTIIKAAGWLAALALLLALGAFVLAQREKDVQMEDLLEENTRLKQSIETLRKVDDETKNDEDLPEEKAAPGQELPLFSVPTDFDPASLVQNMLAQSQDPGMDSAFDPMAKLFNSPEGRRMAEYGARTAVNMQYRPLFEQLALPPEIEARVRELLQDFASEAIDVGLQAFDKDTDFEAMSQLNLEREAKLRNDIAQLLSPEELAIFDEYQETLPERMIEQSYDMLLRMYGTGLSEEKMQLVKQVLVEETLHLPEDPDVPPADALQTYAIQQEEAFARALERLAPDLSEEEYAAVMAFVEQQLSMVDSVTRVLDWRKPVPARTGS